MLFSRPQAAVLARRLRERRRFLAAVVGPRQVGRDRDREVDFVAKAGQTLTAIEVKSGRARDGQPGLAAFAEAYRPKRTLLVGGDGIPLEEFLSRPVAHWVKG